MTATLEEIPVDAYSSYIKILNDARMSELRREAAEYALSRAARNGRPSRWAPIGSRIRSARRSRPAMEPVTPIELPCPAPEVELRRSA